MEDFLDLTETQFISFAQSLAVKQVGSRKDRRYQAAYVGNDAITTDWSATLTVIGHS